MPGILIWTFIAYGITSILVWGSIFERFRNWLKKDESFFGPLISCVLCTSTWVGFFMSFFLGSLTHHFFHTFWILHVFFDGMFTAGAVWALNSVVEYFEENRPKN